MKRVRWDQFANPGDRDDWRLTGAKMHDWIVSMLSQHFGKVRKSKESSQVATGREALRRDETDKVRMKREGIMHSTSLKLACWLLAEEVIDFFK